MATSPTTATLAQNVPGTAFLDPNTTDISLPWRVFLTTLLRRTGGTQGGLGATQAALDAETAARQAADQVLTTAASGERAARQAADTAEAEARQSIDSSTSLRISQEVADRIAGDALMVPLAQLCSLWAQCDFGFLPTADPGHGQVWLDGGRLTVGSPPSNIGLEDGSGMWTLEAVGTADDWQWG